MEHLAKPLRTRNRAPFPIADRFHLISLEPLFVHAEITYPINVCRSVLQISEESYLDLTLVLERNMAVETWTVRRRLGQMSSSAERLSLREERRKFASGLTAKFAQLTEQVRAHAEAITNYETEISRLK